MHVHLPTVEQVLPDGVECYGYRCQRIEVDVCHPYSKGGVLLPQHLASGNDVSVVAAYQFPYSKLDGADCNGYCSKNNYAVYVFCSMEEYEVDGLAECYGKG